MSRNRSAAAFAAVLAATLFLAPPWAQAEGGKKSWLDLTLYGGFASSRVTGTTLYQAGWSANYLSQVDEQTSIANYPGPGLAAGASLTLYLAGDVGLQVLAGAMHGPVDNTSTFDFHWVWTSGSEQAMERNWDRSGSVSSLPLSINLAARFGSGKVEGVVSGGVSLFRNTFQSESLFGYGVTTLDSSIDDQNNVTVTQHVDALPIPLRIPATSWTATGANLGIGMNVAVNDKLSLLIEARYFYCPAKTLTWNFVYGSYDGIFFTDINGQPFGAAEAAGLAQFGNAFTLSVNPSFYQLCLGVVFHLGGAGGN
jgi:hypothetical protein